MKNVRSILIDTKGSSITDPTHYTGDTSLIVKGGGSVTLSGCNLYTGSTTIQEGTTVRAGNPQALSPNSIFDLTDSGIIDLNGQNSAIKGLTSALSCKGGVRFGSSEISVGAGSAAPSTFYGYLAGVGRFVKEGAGTLTLAGSMSQGKPSIVIKDRSTLAITGSSIFLGDVSLEDKTLLIIDSAASGVRGATIFGAISGQGSLKKIGNGSLSLQTNGAASDYSGETIVSEGTLVALTPDAISPNSAFPCSSIPPEKELLPEILAFVAGLTTTPPGPAIVPAKSTFAKLKIKEPALKLSAPSPSKSVPGPISKSLPTVTTPLLPIVREQVVGKLNVSVVTTLPS